MRVELTNNGFAIQCLIHLATRAITFAKMNAAKAHNDLQTHFVLFVAKILVWSGRSLAGHTVVGTQRPDQYFWIVVNWTGARLKVVTFLLTLLWMRSMF